jgi:CBS domain-containing protein
LTVYVRDGMTRIVVTVGPGHTLREAARRMTDAGVGAAVVVDPDGEGPGIVTERDLLHAGGHGNDFDTERVGDHMTQRLTYAAADWSLERAAQEMVRARFRHVVVLDGSEVVGILSMRDIVRCLVETGTITENESKPQESSMGQAAAI